MKHSFEYLRKRYAFYWWGRQAASELDRASALGCGRVLRPYVGIHYRQHLGASSGIDEWLMASLGASILLVFALPSSPMFQPWAVIAGNTISALIGISCFHLIAEPLFSLPVAAAFSILGMFILRCLHPQAAAVVLIVVLGEIGLYRYAFFPVMVDSI
jgi:CBS domain-containing membrane protein